MEADKDDEAIAFLKRAISLAPEMGQLYYLLGALHAEIGLIDRAVEEITRAIELAPELSTARFQLGLLHLSTGAFDEAQEAWRPLDQLDENDPLRIFKTGLVHLGNGELEACVVELKRGLAVSKHGSLNDDMRGIIEKTESELAAAKPEQSAAPQRKPEPASRQMAKRGQGDTQHVLLAGYRHEDAKK
jgi:tetratricopeptide (TPR) repeat protein